MSNSVTLKFNSLAIYALILRLLPSNLMNCLWKFIEYHGRNFSEESGIFKAKLSIVTMTRKLRGEKKNKIKFNKREWSCKKCIIFHLMVGSCDRFRFVYRVYLRTELKVEVERPSCKHYITWKMLKVHYRVK